MTEREVLKLALDAFGEIAWSNETQWQRDRAKEAITAIKESLAQPEHEPWSNVGIGVDVTKEGVSVVGIYKISNDSSHLFYSQFYTTPPQRKPLTDEEIILIVADCASSHQHTDIHFARAIEASHGIKELV